MRRPGGRRPPRSKTLRRASSHSESGQASETRNRPPPPTPETVKHSPCASASLRCSSASAARSKSGSGAVAPVFAAASATGAVAAGAAPHQQRARHPGHAPVAGRQGGLEPVHFAAQAVDLARGAQAVGLLEYRDWIFPISRARSPRNSERRPRSPTSLADTPPQGLAVPCRSAFIQAAQGYLTLPGGSAHAPQRRSNMGRTKPTHTITESM